MKTAAVIKNRMCRSFIFLRTVQKAEETTEIRTTGEMTVRTEAAPTRGQVISAAQTTEITAQETVSAVTAEMMQEAHIRETEIPGREQELRSRETAVMTDKAAVLEMTAQVEIHQGLRLTGMITGQTEVFVEMITEAVTTEASGETEMITGATEEISEAQTEVSAEMTTGETQEIPAVREMTQDREVSLTREESTTAGTQRQRMI